MRRDHIYDRIHRVEAEYRIAERAVAGFAANCARDPRLLADLNVTVTRVAQCKDNLLRTYIVRVFAEFEAALRNYYGSRRGCRRTGRPPAEVLLDTLATRRNVDSTPLANAHLVREARNEVLHEGEPAVGITMADCRSYLRRYLSYLPDEW